jgi:hypothetical protein
MVAKSGRLGCLWKFGFTVIAISLRTRAGRGIKLLLFLPSFVASSHKHF